LVLYPDQKDLKLLNTFEEKAELLKAQGIDHLVRIPFTKDFASTSSSDFIRNILVEKIGTKKLVIGYDHRFGKNREGSFEHLKANSRQYGFDVEEISRQDIDDVAVSSTKIRNSLTDGAVDEAAQLLGNFYSIRGRVVKGEKIGRIIGFPTANIEIDFKHKLIPADGCYAVKVTHRNNHLKGMLNIGYRPTVGGSRKTIEVNIFDFSEDIYGDEIIVSFIERIRDELKFEDVEALKNQLKKDKTKATEILN